VKVQAGGKAGRTQQAQAGAAGEPREACSRAVVREARSTHPAVVVPRAASRGNEGRQSSVRTATHVSGSGGRGWKWWQAWQWQPQRCNRGAGVGVSVVPGTSAGNPAA